MPQRSHRHPPHRQWRLVGILVAVGLAAPSLAGAVSASGTAALTIGGPGLVQVGGSGGQVRVSLAGTTGTRADLPVMAVDLGRAGRANGVRLAGLIRLRARAGGRTRTILLSAPRATLGARPQLTAMVGGRRRAILVAAPGGASLRVAARSARLGSTRMVVAPGAGRLLQRRLALPRPLSGRVANLRMSARWQPASPAPVPPAAPTPVAPPAPSPGPAVPVEGPALSRPGGAVDVRAATLTWRVRDSFVQYLSGGTAPGDGVSALAPATSHPLESGCTSSGTVNTAQLAYRFDLPFVAGWFNPADGRAALRFGGGIHFGHRSHTIDLSATNPDIELEGGRARAVFQVAGTGGTAVAPGRARLIDLALDPAPAACAVDPGPVGAHAPDGGPAEGGGRHYVYERSAGVIPAAAAGSVFAGFYSPGEPFGWMTLTFTTAPH